MYTSFQVKNFRCFDDLKLDNLSRVNLIAGKNNVGKTALLEAIMIHAGNYDGYFLLRLPDYTEMRKPPENRSLPDWDALFRNFNTLSPILFSGKYIDPQKLPTMDTDEWIVEVEIVRELEKLVESRSLAYVLRNTSVDIGQSGENLKALQFKNSKRKEQTYFVVQAQGRIHRDIRELIYQSFPSVMLSSSRKIPFSEDAERFSDLKRNRKLEGLLNVLKLIEPRIIDLDLLSDGFYVDIKLPHLIPQSAMGDGINRITSLVLAISKAANGVVLVDEIENGLHYTILEDIWKAIALAAEEFNVQVFATTHSLECIQAAHKAFSESPTYDFRYHRLDRTKLGDIRVVSYDEEIMEAAMETESEVR